MFLFSSLPSFLKSKEKLSSGKVKKNSCGTMVENHWLRLVGRTGHYQGSLSISVLLGGVHTSSVVRQCRSKQLFESMLTVVKSDLPKPNWFAIFIWVFILSMDLQLNWKSGRKIVPNNVLLELCILMLCLELLLLINAFWNVNTATK